jgi:hypothetical protein
MTSPSVGFVFSFLLQIGGEPGFVDLEAFEGARLSI